MIRRKILIADSSEDARSAVAEALRERFKGVQIVEAADGADALDRLAEGGVVVVVTALGLARIGGDELVRIAREHDYAAEFVVLTGDPFAPDLIHGARVFRKPDDVLALVGHVCRLLRRGRAA